VFVFTCCWENEELDAIDVKGLELDGGAFPCSPALFCLAAVMDLELLINIK